MSFPSFMLNKLEWLKIQEPGIQFIYGVLVTSVGPPTLVPVPTTRTVPEGRSIAVNDLNVRVWVPVTLRRDGVAIRQSHKGMLTLGILGKGYSRQCVTVIRGTAIVPDLESLSLDGNSVVREPNTSKNVLLLKTDCGGTLMDCTKMDICVFGEIFRTLLEPDDMIILEPIDET